jgi:DNA invertase Pin-like site-specific DNA recombinase
MKPVEESLYVGTSRADTAYHAAWANKWQVTGGGPPAGVTRSAEVRALCGMPIRLTPRPWDRPRHARPDGCHRCRKLVQAAWDAEERERAKRGPLIAGYIRASTDKQIDSPEVQRAAILDYARGRGLAEPTFYVDTAISGAEPLHRRPAGAALMKDVRKGDQVIVAKVDRLSRNFLDFISTMDAWTRIGVTFHPIDLPMLIMRPDDHLTHAFLQMLMVFATLERQMLAQRITEAHRWRMSIGRRSTRHARKGFKWVKKADGKEYEEIDTDEAAVCIRALELTTMGYIQQQVADYLNEEWGVRNRAGRPYRQQDIRRMVDNAIEIMKKQDIALPEGVENPEDLLI